MLDGATGLAMTSSANIPYEEIAALQPDLILVTYFAEDQAIYDRLNAIAPTIGLLGDRQVDTWQDMIAVGGQIFGKADEAAAVTAEVDELMATTAAELPGLQGKTFALANFVPGDQIYVVADQEDGSSVFFQQLGMELDPDVLAAADGVSGRAEFSYEQIGLLDGDLLVALHQRRGPEHHRRLRPARRWSRTGPRPCWTTPTSSALNTPTPLSIPYVLEIVRPQLAVAAAGGS